MSAAPINSLTECMDKRGIPISTVLTGKSVDATDPSVPPPLTSERLTNRWYGIWFRSQIWRRIATASASVALGTSLFYAESFSQYRLVRDVHFAFVVRMRGVGHIHRKKHCAIDRLVDFFLRTLQRPKDTPGHIMKQNGCRPLLTAASYLFMVKKCDYIYSFFSICIDNCW